MKFPFFYSALLSSLPSFSTNTPTLMPSFDFNDPSLSPTILSISAPMTSSDANSTQTTNVPSSTPVMETTFSPSETKIVTPNDEASSNQDTFSTNGILFYMS